VIEGSQVAVVTTRGKFAVFAGNATPIFEELAIFAAAIECIRRKSGGKQGGVPGGKESQDGVLRDSGVGKEFAARRRATEAARESDERFEDTLPVWAGLHKEKRIEKEKASRRREAQIPTQKLYHKRKSIVK
jgi:hypothetical protein